MVCGNGYHLNTNLLGLTILKMILKLLQMIKVLSILVILKCLKICPGVFGEIRPVGYCMIGKR